MRITVRQLKRIIKEAVQAAPRKRSRRLNESKERMLVDFIKDLHGEFGHTFGDEGGEMSWDEVMDYASNMGVRTTPEELEKVFQNSKKLDTLRWIMRVTPSGFFFEDPMAL